PKPRLILDVYEQAGPHRRLRASQRIVVHRGIFSARPALGVPRGRRYVLIARTAAGGGTLAGASAPLSLTY
ncbi:MAG: hypothetical protein ACRDK8_08535, partial [Solirubrobacteraceae bacterium]